MSQVYILGAGISGLGAGYSLRKRGISSVILEKDITYGGLCGNFEINGFRLTGLYISPSVIMKR